MQSTRSRMRTKEEGSAFVISILVLFVLTVLGMALMLTTTTEKDIAVNYRWGEQAFFNADAALEYGKNLLASYLVANNDFSAILPPARADVRVPDANAPWGAALPEAICDITSPGCRHYQYFADRCPADGCKLCARLHRARPRAGRRHLGAIRFPFTARSCRRSRRKWNLRPWKEPPHCGCGDLWSASRITALPAPICRQVVTIAPFLLPKARHPARWVREPAVRCPCDDWK